MADSVTKKVKDFVVNDTITAYFAVREKQIRESVRGQFVSLELGDSSGRIKAVVWEPDYFTLTDLSEGMVVKVRGTVGEYQGKQQIVIQQVRQAKESEYTLEDILPHSEQTEAVRRQRVLSLTDKVKHADIKRLLDSFWNDNTFFSDYLRAAAGKLWHHAYVGGLSEHSANVTELALRVAEGYDFLRTDHLIFGGLMHDIGKISQYKIENAIDFTDEGRLLGHISIADAWILERANKLGGIDENLLAQLRHLVLSHHGMLEYASPVVPQTPEAFVLFYSDEIDSKMGAMSRIRERQGGVGWSEYVKLLDRFLYFGKEAKE